MRNIIVTTVFLALSACGTPEAPKADPGTPEPTAEVAKPTDAASRAAAIAKEIRATPDKAAEILAGNGMTEAEFEALLFDVASSPELSAKYEAALK